MKRVEFVASFSRDYKFTEESVARHAKEWAIDITSGTEEENEKSITSVVEAMAKIAYQSDQEENQLIYHNEGEYPLSVTMNFYEEEEESQKEE